MTVQDDAPLLITEHELIALVALAGTDAALKCQHLFRLDHAAGAPLEQAGVSPLLERGLMTVEADALQPVGPAASVAAALAGADAWLEIARAEGMTLTAVEMVNFYLGSAPDGRPAAATVRRHLADGTSHAVHVKAVPDGSVELREGEGEDQAAVSFRPEDLDSSLRKSLGLQPA